jgi:hypothetical protein
MSFRFFQELRLIPVSPFVRLDVPEARIWIVFIIGERFTVLDEVLHIIYRYGKTKTAVENVPHISHANYFTSQIKQRPAAVSRIDIRIGLNIDQPLKSSASGTDYTVGNCSFQTQRITYSKDLLTDPYPVDVT